MVNSDDGMARHEVARQVLLLAGDFLSSGKFLSALDAVRGGEAIALLRDVYAQVASAATVYAVDAGLCSYEEVIRWRADFGLSAEDFGVVVMSCVMGSDVVLRALPGSGLWAFRDVVRSRFGVSVELLDDAEGVIWC